MGELVVSGETHITQMLTKSYNTIRLYHDSNAATMKCVAELVCQLIVLWCVALSLCLLTKSR